MRPLLTNIESDNLVGNPVFTFNIMDLRKKILIPLVTNGAKNLSTSVMTLEDIHGAEVSQAKICV